MLTNILKYLKGYVVIRLSGYSPERFLNLCSHHHIVLWGIRSVGVEYEMCISLSGFRKLRPLVRKTKTKVVILERHGLPFILHRYRNRKLFAGGAVIGAVLLYVMSLFIWNIHVEGNYSLSDQVVLNYLESEQIIHGMRKSDVHGEVIEAELRERFPEITWTSVEVKGTRLIIHIEENTDTVQEQIAVEEPADLIASRDGTVVSVIVRSGTPKAEEGTEVKKGDLLVAARVEILDDAGEVSNAYDVHADADIRIQYRETYESSFSMNYVKKQYTGRQKSSFYLLLGKRRLELGLPSGEKYEYADDLTSELQLKITENFYLPVTLGRRIVREYVPTEAIYTQQEAFSKAQEELQLFFEKLSIKGIQIIENNVKIKVNGDLCIAAGDYLAEESAVKAQTPEIKIPDQEKTPGEEREQT